MALGGCSSGLVVTALVAALLLPAQYYVPELYPPPPPPPAAPHPSPAWIDLAFTHLPPVDLLFTISLILVAFLTYICEWIQRKLMERRIVKMKQYLEASVESLRVWDAKQEQLETTLKMVQNATCEYNLLLYLLLRQHRYFAHSSPPSECFFEKDLDEDLSFLKATLDTQPMGT